MHADALVIAGLIVGFVVGMTGMGGGALMTPILVLILKVTPSTAVASDLVASLIMKPVGAGVHAKRGTVHRNLVLWLCVGSVPSAFAGVLILRSLGNDKSLQDHIKFFLGAALIVAASTMIVKSLLDGRRRRALAAAGKADVDEPLQVKIVPTILIGILGGLVVGMTSVGSGSLIIVMLLVLYPRLTASQLVGTDLMQAIPLVGAASLGHILFGDFQMSVTLWLLVGAIPAVYVGARLSAKAPDHIIRPVLVIVLIASSLKLLDKNMTANQLGLAVGACLAIWAGLLAVRKVRSGAIAPLSAQPLRVFEATAVD